MFGLSHFRNQFEYGVDYEYARQQVINRLQSVDLPAGRHAADFTCLADRRNRALYAYRSQGLARPLGLHAERFEISAGLDAATRVPPRAATRAWSVPAAK